LVWIASFDDLVWLDQILRFAQDDKERPA
jgi:hypothetical protein